MNNYLLCVFTVFIYFNRPTTLVATKTYKFERSSDKNVKLTDYIQLVSQNDSIVEGKYYGNENGFHFVADIKFDKNVTNNAFSFSLINYKFCREESNPFYQINYYEIDSLPFNLKERVNFYGIMSGKQLVLRRTFWYYDSRFDKMIFNLVK